MFQCFLLWIRELKLPMCKSKNMFLNLLRTRQERDSFRLADSYLLSIKMYSRFACITDTMYNHLLSLSSDLVLRYQTKIISIEEISQNKRIVIYRNELQPVLRKLHFRKILNSL